MHCTQDEITRLRFRFHNGYSTQTWISANGNVSNRCGKHGCTLRFRNCGSAETHSLNLRIRNVYAVTETLISIVFPRLVNSTDTQLSAGFPKSKCNDKSRIHKVYAVTETLKDVMFPRFVNLTDTQLSAGFFEGYIIHWEVQGWIGRDFISLVNHRYAYKVGNTLLMWMHSSTYGIPIGINQRSDSYTTFKSGSCINKRL